jgi:hypothetical protein
MNLLRSLHWLFTYGTPHGGIQFNVGFGLLEKLRDRFDIGDAAWGLSSKAVGVRSDGLVQIENAYVPGAHRAFVHRSHSGCYGLVTSEEGFQN